MKVAWVAKSPAVNGHHFQTTKKISKGSKIKIRVGHVGSVWLYVCGQPYKGNDDGEILIFTVPRTAPVRIGVGHQTGDEKTRGASALEGEAWRLKFEDSSLDIKIYRADF